MEFYEVLEHVLDLLQRYGRVTYRALKRQFHLDDDYIADLKAELIQARRLAVDEAGEVLVWTGHADTAPLPSPRAPQPAPPPATSEVQPTQGRPPSTAPQSHDAERRQHRGFVLLLHRLLHGLRSPSLGPRTGRHASQETAASRTHPTVRNALCRSQPGSCKAWMAAPLPPRDPATIVPGAYGILVGGSCTRTAVPARACCSECR